MTQRPLRLAHLSDVHVLELQGTPWRAFLNKRATGAVNLLGPRRGAHPTSAADHLAGELAARLRDGRLDHVLITGDLTNLSLESEYRAARAVVERIGSPAQVTVIPGNHDVYTEDAAQSRAFERHFAEYVAAPGDDAARDALRARGRAAYPVRRVIDGRVAVYILCSALPTVALTAWGRVGRAQRDRLRALRRTEPAGIESRLLLVHHNLHTRGARKDATSGLRDRLAVSRVADQIGADAILHGHDHHPYAGHVDRNNRRPLLILGAGSSTWQRTEAGLGAARFSVLTMTSNGVTAVERWAAPSPDAAFTVEHDAVLHDALGRPLDPLPTLAPARDDA